MTDHRSARAGHRSRFKRTAKSPSKRVPTKHVPGALIAQAKRLYTQTNVPVEDICALLGIGTYTFHKRLKLWGWPMRSKRIPREEPKESVMLGAAGDGGGPDAGAESSASGTDARSALVPPTEAERVALAARVFRLLKNEVEIQERTAKELGLELSSPGESAERSRSLAALSRALRVVNILAEIEQEGSSENDERIFRSLEDLGRAISERMGEMDARNARRISGKDAAG